MTKKTITGLCGALLLFIAVLVAYSNHFHNGFHFDDGHTIVDNASIRDLRNIPLFFEDATTFSALPTNQSYRPLISTLVAIDYWLGHGLKPFWFHLSIFAFFIALSLLLVLLIHQLLERSAVTISDHAKLWIAYAAAACYALHPANADAINYIIASAEMIATLGVIASFALYFAFRRLRPYFLFVLPAALATLAKSTAAIFPLLFALFRLSFPNEVPKRAGRARFVALAPPFLICGAALLLVQQMTPRSWVAGAVNAHDYLITQPYVALLYLKTFLWPSAISADYDLAPFVSTGDPRFWIGLAFAVFVSVAASAMLFHKKTRLVGFGLLWFLIALPPTSLFPLAEVMNDYRAFLRYVGLVIAAASVAASFVARFASQGNGAKIAAACAVVLFLGANGYATFPKKQSLEN